VSNSRSGRATRTNQASSFLRQAKTGSKPPKGIHHRGAEDAKFGNGFKFGVMAMAERRVTLPESAGKLRTSNPELKTPKGDSRRRTRWRRSSEPNRARPRPPFAAESNVKRAPRSLLLTEPCYTPLKILNLQSPNDGRGRPSHKSGNLSFMARPSKQQPSLTTNLHSVPPPCPLRLCGESPSGFEVWSLEHNRLVLVLVRSPVIAALEAHAILTTNLYSGSPFRVLCASVVNPSPSVTSGTQL
jgi:hypothetical protein